MKKIKNPKLLLFSIVFSFLPGFFGSIFTSRSIPTWYAYLNKPSFNPPNFIFGPVWTTLYVLIGISFYFVLLKRSDKKNVKGKDKTLFDKAIKIFVIQLFLNGLWSILFFGFQDVLLALIEIAVLWIVIILNIYFFYKIEKKSAYLLIPYLLWVSFASFLNYNILILN